MSEENKTGSDNSGSLIDSYLDGGSVDPNKIGEEGKSTAKTNPTGDEGTGDDNEVVPKKQYTELETKIGTQGEELGKYRELFKDTAPLLEKLDADPNLVKAILAGKIDSQLLSGVLEGKIDKKDAETVSKAHDDVKKELGKEYEKKLQQRLSL